jgi:hypothetical protein
MSFLYARLFRRCRRNFVDCCTLSVFFACPFFDMSATTGKIAFPRHHKKCPHGVVFLLTRWTVHACIVPKPHPVIRRTTERLCQCSLHAPLSAPLAAPRVIIAATARTAGAASGAKGGPYHPARALEHTHASCGRRHGAFDAATAAAAAAAVDVIVIVPPGETPESWRPHCQLITGSPSGGGE